MANGKSQKVAMTEAAYIIAGDLAHVRVAQNALREITQANSADYISEEDYKTVMTIFSKWLDEMNKRIEISEGYKAGGDKWEAKSL